MTQEKLFTEALEAFSHSPRFALFKGVQIGRLMPEGCDAIEGIGEITIEQLLEQVRALGGLPESVTPEHAQVLSHLLVALGEDSDTTQLAPDEDISVVVPDSFSSMDIPTLDEQFTSDTGNSESEPPNDVPIGSVPLELGLRAALAKIAAHERYSEVRKRTVGEFWDPDWVAAPFEEAMSLEQLAGLDLAVLFKKRMVTDTRIQSIVRALNRVQRFLDKVSQAKPHKSTEPAVVEDLLAPDCKAAERTSPELQVQHDTPLSPAARAIIEVLDSRGQSHPVLEGLRQRFSRHEWVQIVCGGTLSAHALRDLKRIVENRVPAYVRDLIMALLRAPAVSIEHVARVLMAPDEALSAYSLCLAAVVARALGATPISTSEHGDREFWTLEPHMVKELVQKMARSVRRGSHSTAVTIEVSSTWVDPCLLDLYLQGSKESQGAGTKSRKGPRNRLNTSRRRGK
jgi:hypothetical protein